MSNLKLQKLLYIAHMLHLGRTGQPLINGRFEAWDYGPVEPDVYRRARPFGANPVGNVFQDVPSFWTGTETHAIDETLASLGSAPPGNLVAITHWNNGAWAQYYRPGHRGIVIPNEAISREYLARINANNQRA